MAINKSWTRSAKAIILIEDYPCHGRKYHNLDDNFPDRSPYNKNIEESLKELAENNVSLYCIRITEHTEQMFQIFHNNYKKYTKCNFMLVNMNKGNDLPEIAVNSSSYIYVNQRDNE